MCMWLRVSMAHGVLSELCLLTGVPRQVSNRKPTGTRSNGPDRAPRPSLPCGQTVTPASTSRERRALPWDLQGRPTCPWDSELGRRELVASLLTCPAMDSGQVQTPKVLQGFRSSPPASVALGGKASPMPIPRLRAGGCLYRAWLIYVRRQRRQGASQNLTGHAARWRLARSPWQASATLLSPVGLC